MAAKSNGEKAKTQKEVEKPGKPTCGLIMPISALDNCAAEHWSEVKSIVTEAVESIPDPRFAVKLVSDADAIGIIQKRIVQNVYNSEIVVCDVSGKNPNVMFELGMRLAFDKPTVIIKDDKTEYAFDTGIIEHVPYPRDLRFTKIVDFKNTLADKVLNTHKASLSNPEHSTFLKSFGKFQVASLTETEVSPDRLVISMLEELQTDVHGLKRRIDVTGMRHRTGVGDIGEAMARMLASFQDFKAREKIEDIRALQGNEEFYRFVEKQIDAPKYFDSKTTFVRALEALIDGLETEKR